MRTVTIKLTKRELITIVSVSVLTGAAWLAIIVIFFVIPRRESESAVQIETAYIKGAMIKIAERKTKCVSWIISKNGKVYCE